MGKVENAMQWVINIANDKRYGYDQTNRWGPNYDCSSLLISAFEQAGIKVKTAGASYTGNMLDAFKKCGFKDVTSSINKSTGSGLLKGDVLLKPYDHTVMYIGNGQVVHASINEKGKTQGGASGDQNGKEICIRSYYNKPFTYVLRFEEQPTPSDKIDEDGEWGKDTTKKAQQVFGTVVDGIVSEQYKAYKDKNPGLLSSSFDWKDKPSSKGSLLIKAIQRKVGAKEDGHIGPDTIRDMQEWLGTPIDGKVSNPSVMVKAFQKWLNATS